jgi:hypothetical protein
MATCDNLLRAMHLADTLGIAAVTASALQRRGRYGSYMRSRPLTVSTRVSALHAFVRSLPHVGTL